MDPLYTLNKVYALVSQEERCKNTVQGREERDMISFAMQVFRGGEKRWLVLYNAQKLTQFMGIMDHTPFSNYGRNNHDYDHCH